jgi:hypothetical protein
VRPTDKKAFKEVIAMRRGWLVFFLSFTASILIMVGCGDNPFESVSDDDSEEACRYEVSKNLDEGAWEDVLESSCASYMDRGAAYVGLAGFDIIDVIVEMVDANDEEDDDALDLYMNSLVGDVTDDSLDNLNGAHDEYSAVPSSDDDFEDAEFINVVIVNTLISLSSIKGVLDPEGDGISDCDMNNNDTPDEADAAACAFYIVAGQSCTPVGVTYGSPVNNLSFSGYVNAYNGYQVSIDDNGGPSGAACSSTHKKLLDNTNTSVVATTSDECLDIYGNGTWPCPYEDEGESVDVVAVLQDALSSAGSYLDELVAGDDDIAEAVDELLLEACGADGVCTSAEIAAYLSDLD